MVGHFEQGVLKAIAGGAADEHHPPRLNVGVRQRVLGECKGFIDKLPRHRAGQEPPCRMPLEDGFI
jgi:hypothetical protein